MDCGVWIKVESQWKCCQHQASLLGCGDDLELSGEGYRAFLHTLHSKASGVLIDRKAPTIIPDRNLELVIFMNDREFDCRCRCVLANIIQTFLDDAVDRHIEFMR
jgi:hypothetical protein